ncbi:hypothetical protein QEZ47_07060 [Aminobacter anthyllidis]|uniref:hypothetical protein n=1 Tax=Aminobacter anthyllidis TaxID=1035067 RepID=UPI0024575628|nr:hypothetical protein [Aminobacter anthyllidis]MDH4985303.1 hypothetical protein [Aminobacter anthyllidis]
MQVLDLKHFSSAFFTSGAEAGGAIPVTDVAGATSGSQIPNVRRSNGKRAAAMIPVMVPTTSRAGRDWKDGAAAASPPQTTA